MLSLGSALLVPLAISLLYADGSWESFLIPAAVMVAVGGLGLQATLPRSGRRFGYVLPRDVLLSVTLAWASVALLGRMPFVLDGVFSSPVDSTFESMSGFTTT
jgi:trk system potassium uptake protein TrkH